MTTTAFVCWNLLKRERIIYADGGKAYAASTARGPCTWGLGRGGIRVGHRSKRSPHNGLRGESRGARWRLVVGRGEKDGFDGGGEERAARGPMDVRERRRVKSLCAADDDQHTHTRASATV